MEAGPGGGAGNADGVAWVECARNDHVRHAGIADGTTAAPAVIVSSQQSAVSSGAGGQQEPAGAGDVLEEALKALEAMNAKNWRKQQDVAAGWIRKASKMPS